MTAFAAPNHHVSPMYYFAYGSNLCESRLTARVPSAQFVEIGSISGYDLRFHKRSKDGSGKGDAFHTADAEDMVWGAVAEIDPAEIPRLDRAEGLGFGYDRVEVEIAQGNGSTEHAAIYLANPDAIDASLKPYDWYLELVVAGALARELPDDYINRLASMQTNPDPDKDRKATNVAEGC